jgi:hypothetical protein
VAEIGDLNLCPAFSALGIPQLRQKANEGHPLGSPSFVLFDCAPSRAALAASRVGETQLESVAPPPGPSWLLGTFLQWILVVSAKSYAQFPKGGRNHAEPEGFSVETRCRCRR